MRAFLFEWKKLLICCRGWLIILSVLVIKLGYLLIADSPEYANIELYRNDYIYYMQNVEGRLTGEKINYIEETASRSAAAKSEISQSYSDFYAGNISERECDWQVLKQQDFAVRYKGMNALYEQYLYARQQPECRYMVYPNGWAALLQNDRLDLLFVLTLLVLLIPMFCNEYLCRMDYLAITTVNGSRSFEVHKSAVSVILAMLLSLAFTIGRLVFCITKYGLPHAEYPLQSLAYFSGCPYSVSLGQAFWILAFLRMFGAAFLAALICFAAVLTRRNAASCLLVLCVIGIPFISFSDSLQYRLPMPLGFLRAVGYFLGSEVMADSVTGEETVIFSQVSAVQFLYLCVVSMIIIFWCSLFVCRRNRNKIVLYKTHQKRSSRLAVFLFPCFLFLSGCGKTGVLKEMQVIYNSASSDFYQDDNFFVKAVDQGENVGIWMQKNNEEMINMVRSPFKSEQIYANCIYGNDGIVYYISSYSEDDSNVRLSRRKGKMRVCVRGIYADSMEEFCKFEVYYQKNSEWSFLNFVTGFFMNEKNIWFVTDDAVWQIDLFTHKKEVLNIPLNGNISYDGRRIYFIDDEMRLSEYDTETGRVDKVGNIAAGVYVLASNGIYFSNLRDQNHLYLDRRDGSGVKMIVEKNITSVEIEGGVLQYYVSGDDSVHVMELAEYDK